MDTSAHLCAYKVLLKLLQDKEVHLFRANQLTSHAVENLFDWGFEVLQDDKIPTFLAKSTRCAQVLKLVNELKKTHSDKRIDEEIDHILTTMDINNNAPFSVLQPTSPNQSPLPTTDNNSVSNSGSNTRSQSSLADSDIGNNDIDVVIMTLMVVIMKCGVVQT